MAKHLEFVGKDSRISAKYFKNFSQKNSRVAQVAIGRTTVREPVALLFDEVRA